MEKEKQASLSFKKHPIFSTISIGFIALYCVSLVFSLFWCLYSSFKDSVDLQLNPLGFPEVWMFENYATAFSALKVTVGQRTITLIGLLFNSITYTLLYTLAPIIGNVLVAYGCARYQSKWGNVLYFTVILLITVPRIGGLSSSLVIAMEVIHTYDNLFLAAVWNIMPKGVPFLVFYTTFKGIDKAYSDAAKIDGAGHWRIFLTIIIPLSKNIIIAYLTTGIVACWNDWNTPMIWFPSSPTLAYGLYLFQRSTANAASSVPIILTGCMLVMIPMLVLFIFVKDRLIGQVSFGGLKG